MRILIVGAGGVGAAMAAIAVRRSFFDELVIADVDLLRAQRAVKASGDPRRLRAAHLDAGDRAAIVDLARRHRSDVIVNACDPRLNPPIFEAAAAVGCTYVDMAMHLSTPHPERPFELPGIKLGDAQFAVSDKWAQRGQLALVGMGVESGLSDVFARYASDHLFSEMHEIGVRDGSDLRIEGRSFAPTFSIWTTIEECLNPPLVWERNRGWYTTEPFSEPELFEFPAGIGTIRCVNVEHEEVVLMPRWLDCERVTFKYGLDDEFIEILKMLHKLGLDATAPVQVRDKSVSPRDVVAALLPNPAELGNEMVGRTCAGTWVRGLDRHGVARSTYLHHIVDNETVMREYGHQAVVWQTAINPVIALELLSRGTWHGQGVMGPEAFDAVPFLELLDAYGSPWAMQEMTFDGRLAAAPSPRQDRLVAAL
jgi:saccharopine dehydrogenase (NAD+, L-lysine forming)